MPIDTMRLTRAWITGKLPLTRPWRPDALPREDDAMISGARFVHAGFPTLAALLVTLLTGWNLPP